MPTSPSEFQSRAVRALVLLHEEHLRRFFPVWRRAQAASVSLPSSNEPAYASLDALGRHVVGAARGYLVWICEMLQLPDPEVRSVPEAATLSREAESYLEHLLQCWRTSLVKIHDDQMETVYRSRWGTLYSIDAMLEHAVMHPIRHVFQLEELMKEEDRRA